jgi:hypothetical protein
LCAEDTSNVAIKKSAAEKQERFNKVSQTRTPREAPVVIDGRAVL